MVGFDIFKVQPKTYNKKLATALVLKIAKGKDERVINNYRIELFELMSKIVVKNINNYLKLMTNSDVKSEILQAEEAQSEAFMIMIKCISQFKFDKDYCFYFYLNKALSRNFYKMLCESKRGKANFEKVSDMMRIRKSSSTNQSHDMDFLISQLKISDDEIIVLNSKLLGQPKQDFLDSNKNFTPAKYSKCNSNVKLIIQKLIEDGEL